MLVAVLLLAVILGLLWKTLGHPSPRHVFVCDLVDRLAISEQPSEVIAISEATGRRASA